MTFSPKFISEEEINDLRSLVSRYFPVYSTRIEGDSLVFFCEVNENTLERKFDSLRLELREKGYIPIIKNVHGEYLLYLAPFSQKKGRSVSVNLLMLILTIISTSFAGILHWASYTGSEDPFTLSNILNGILYFSLPLLLILGTHEMGHYYMAKKRNVRASLPFFMPFMPPLGTMGAFISLREPIPDKKSLLDIGIAGPLAGFAVAVPVTILGMFLGSIQPPADTSMQAGTSYMLIQVPLIYQFLTFFIPAGQFMHPTAFAGWVGFIVTAINLFPAGQLDGGHIARAALGEKAKYASYGSLAVLFLIGIFTNYWGWIIFGSLIFFLGVRHAPPLNDITPLDSGRKALAVVAALMLAVSFVVVPMSSYTPAVGISLEPLDSSVPLNITLEAGAESDLNFSLSNTGEGYENISVLVAHPQGWNVSVFDMGSTQSHGTAFMQYLDAGESANYTLVIRVPENATPFLYHVDVFASYGDVHRSIRMSILIPGNSTFSMAVLPQSRSASPGDELDYAVDIVSLSPHPQNLSLSVAAPGGWQVLINGTDSDSIHLRLEAYGSTSLNFSVKVPDTQENGTYAVVASVISYDSGEIHSSYLSVSIYSQSQERSST